MRKPNNSAQLRIDGVEQKSLHLLEIEAKMISKRALKIHLYQHQTKLSHQIIELGNELRDLEEKKRKEQRRYALGNI